MRDLPVIDVSPLRSANLAERIACAGLLGEACREVGFFYVTGHGLPPDTMNGVFAAAHELFAQPAAVKESLSIALSAHNRGYVGLGRERLDATTPPDRKEAFNIGLDLAPDDAELLARKRFRGVNFWPDLPGWRQTVLGYYAACHQLVLDIHRGFKISLRRCLTGRSPPCGCCIIRRASRGERKPANWGPGRIPTTAT
jgi:isopenicillin N synthase-like dioxygenase